MALSTSIALRLPLLVPKSSCMKLLPTAAPGLPMESKVGISALPPNIIAVIACIFRKQEPNAQQKLSNFST